MSKAQVQKKVKLGFDVTRLRAKSRVDFGRLKSKSRVDFANRIIRFADQKGLEMQEEEFEQEIEEEREAEAEAEGEGEQVKEEEHSETQDSFDEQSIEDGEEDGHLTHDDASSSDLIESEVELFSRLSKALSGRRATIKRKPDFFALLGRVPDIDEISLSESTPRYIASEVDETIEEEEAAEEETSVHEDSSTEYSELDYEIPSSDEDELTLIKPIEEEDFFEDMFKKAAVGFTKYDPTLQARLEALIVLKNDTHKFLNALIDAVVDVAEYIDTKEAVRENMDKVKLFRELMRLLDELFAESKVSDFLNTKCIHHYRRVRDFRPLTPESEETFSYEVRKYEDALGRFNCLLGNETAKKEAYAKRVNEAEKLKTELEERAKLASAGLEAAMRKTLSLRDSKVIRLIIDQGIQEIKSLRQQITDLREVLIKRQHVRGTLLEKMSNVQDVTDQLHLREYERMIDEEYGLFRKLEEKSERLANIFHDFNSHTSIVAHIREKQDMFLHAIRSQRKAFHAADAERENLRSYIHQLKLNHIHMRKEIGEKHFDTGLIGKPALLMDFDKTVERGQQLKARVDGFKEEINRLEHRIGFLEGRVACN